MRMLRHSDKRVSSFLWCNDVDGSGNRTSAKARRRQKREMTRTLRAILKADLYKETHTQE